MADLSKIKLNGTTYNFKDAGARTAIGNLTSFDVEIISSFPANPNTHTIYFKSKTGTTNDAYDEYMYIGNAWEKIGSTDIDLSGYLQTSDIAAWAKASSKPTYTASEVGAAASTHAHGNITSGGDITTTVAIASGDRLVINDESASKVNNSSITFGSSTTQYLANNGTWQNVPSAYDDTALAARVTALEQIPWVTYYTGANAPSNSQGSNGDLYLQTSSS